MADWALAIHHDPDFAAVLLHGVRKVLPGIAGYHASNLEDGWKRLQSEGLKSCRIVISGMRVPRSASSEVPALDGEERTSLELVKRIRDLRVEELPVLLVAAVNYSDEAVRDFKNVEVVCVNDIAERLVEVIRGVLGLQQKRREWRNVDLEISLQQKGHNWHLRRSSPFVENNGALDIQPGAIERLRSYSTAVRFEALQDAGYLSAIGKDMYEAVMGADAEGATLRWRLQELCDKTLGIQGSRIRFVVDQHTYPILLESVTEPKHAEDLDFWMLRAPLFRSLRGKTERPPLFTDGESRSKPLDCLIVQGNTAEFTNSKLKRKFNPVPRVAEEVTELETCLKGRNIGRVRVLRYDPAAARVGARFSDKVRRELRKRDWDLVHYAGHSIGGMPMQGYVVFGANEDDAVPAEEFACWLAKCRFVFMSSCESAGVDFVLQMIERTVPAIVGFRWPIGDSPAKFFAQQFYDYLLSDDEVDRHLEYAFFKAKRALHQQYRQGPPVWAAPVLVMQVEPSEKA